MNEMTYDIICVDDETHMTSMFKSVINFIFEEAGTTLRINTYNSTNDVLRDIQEKKVSAKVWLLDIMMQRGELNGVELAERLRMLFPSQKMYIYAFTALNPNVIVERYAKGGTFDGAFNKSQRPLEATVREIIDTHFKYIYEGGEPEDSGDLPDYDSLVKPKETSAPVSKKQFKVSLPSKPAEDAGDDFDKPVEIPENKLNYARNLRPTQEDTGIDEFFSQMDRFFNQNDQGNDESDGAEQAVQSHFVEPEIEDEKPNDVEVETAELEAGDSDQTLVMEGGESTLAETTADETPPLAVEPVEAALVQFPESEKPLETEKLPVRKPVSDSHPKIPVRAVSAPEKRALHQKPSVAQGKSVSKPDRKPAQMPVQKPVSAPHRTQTKPVSVPRTQPGSVQMQNQQKRASTTQLAVSPKRFNVSEFLVDFGQQEEPREKTGAIKTTEKGTFSFEVGGGDTVPQKKPTPQPRVTAQPIAQARPQPSNLKQARQSVPATPAPVDPQPVQEQTAMPAITPEQDGVRLPKQFVILAVVYMVLITLGLAGLAAYVFLF